MGVHHSNITVSSRLVSRIDQTPADNLGSLFSCQLSDNAWRREHIREPVTAQQHNIISVQFKRTNVWIYILNHANILGYLPLVQISNDILVFDLFPSYIQPDQLATLSRRNSRHRQAFFEHQ